MSDIRLVPMTAEQYRMIQGFLEPVLRDGPYNATRAALQRELADAYEQGITEEGLERLVGDALDALHSSGYATPPALREQLPGDVRRAAFEEQDAIRRAEYALVPLDALIGDLRYWGGMVSAEAVLKRLADVRAALEGEK